MNVTDTLILDLRPVCVEIDHRLGQFLAPHQPGLYLPYGFDPVIQQGRIYLNRQANGKTTLFDPTKDVWKAGALYEGQGKLVVDAEQAKKLAPTPTLSPTVIKMIRACTEDLMNKHARWMHPTQEKYVETDETLLIKQQSARDLYNDRMADIQELANSGKSVDPRFLQEKMQEAISDLRRSEQEVSNGLNRLENSSVVDLRDSIRPYVRAEYAHDNELLDALEYHLLNLRNSIVDFLGENRWIMHFQKIKMGTLEIEKTVDYRIMQYHRLTNTPWTP